MIETIEALMPSSSLDISSALLIISLCALIDILSPGVLTVTAYLLLTQPNQLSSRLFVFLFITQLGYFITGLLLYFGGNSLLKRIEQLSQFDFINWFYILLGAVLVLISFSKPKETTKKRLISFIPKNTTIKGMIILGIIVFLIEFVTALPYFYSIFLMNHQTIETTPAILIIIGYNLVMVLPSLLLLGVNIIFKERLQQFLIKIRSKLNEAPISSLLVATGVIGAVFFNIGLRGILN
ncbi:MAG: GAP family protein [Bacillaceae bacterium]|uniref:GAP family protein n=2 Tax=Bacillaceae TaxID=186817 RepID=A0A4U1D3D3_9BACI|nr:MULTISPECIES: GAP family protein [Bacillaceae]REJ13372.1 MAG: GAP family protein [Bacillaceae bacterium]TKC16233.1 GAP family protein [Robertmurraya kyonggiensis]